ncbi:unnamed protein product [Microthlaspi erraticum]|uniref:Uncharacterized protein n=1 Tax=Microthlaspi erraticum TaxID=1685480 RepID=A0A6D2HFJ5_9BRAS|nr:unnamed protein product [Microthlaspi erraticum]
MDFIKTSSLRALIELTFQCKWNGLIWMSRKGVIAKRVKAAPDGHIENQRPNAQSGWPRNECSALGQSCVRPTDRSADHAHDPGNSSPRSAKPTPRHAAHDQAREPGNASRPRNSSVPRRCIRPTGRTPASGREISSAKSIRPTKPADRESIRPRPFRLSQTRLSGRSSRRPSERRGRPEAVFEAQSAQFKPKAGADLARLAFQVFLVRHGEGATSLFPYKGDANSPHTTSKHLLSEQEMLSPQAPPPSWDSPPRPSTLKTKKKLLPYLEAADLETSSQAASHQEEYLLATPEEEINPELIEFVKRDQFHDLFSEYALEHIDHFDNLVCKKPPFKSKYHHYSHQLEGERDEEEWGGIPPILINEELIKHVERNPFYNSISECAKEHLCNFEQLCHDYGLGDNPKKIQLFQLSLAGQAKDWAKFNAQHAFKTWNGYKGSFPPQI